MQKSMPEEITAKGGKGRIVRERDEYATKTE